MTRDEITKFVAELVAGYDMEPEDAAALHEMGKLAALRAPAVTGEAERRINTRCPSCGSSTLFVAEGGHLTCSLIGCKQPGVERAIAELRSAPPAAGAPPALVAWQPIEMAPKDGTRVLVFQYGLLASTRQS